MIDQPEGCPAVFEPLEISAPLARAFAERSCEKAEAGGISCAWYHGLWQYLRLLEVVRTVRADRDLLISESRKLGRTGSFQRVLITGAADYGMLAHLLAGYRQAGTTPEFTILDRCPTPLWLNSWYADEVGISIKALKADALDLPGASQFDLVCAHSFFSYIPPGARVRLTRNWAAQLRPGGKLLISQIMRPDHPDPEIMFDPAEAHEFCDRVMRKAGEMKRLRRMIPKDLEHMARRFAAHKHGYRIQRESEILAPLRAAGFALERVSGSATRGKKTDDVPLAPTRGVSYRLHVLATRE